MRTTQCGAKPFLPPAAVRAAPCALSAGMAQAQQPTNVLFVLADQWRFSAFGHGGDPVVTTPTFDRFAQQGARFTRMYAANPVCTPNRSCIMTGRYSHQHGMTHNDIMLPPRERTIGHAFSAAGYATHYIGKWHMDGEEKPGFVPPGWRRRGFQTFEGFNRGHYYPTGAKYFTNGGELLHPDVYEPTYQTDLAISFLERNRNHPFYCYLSWGPPHTPYHPPKEWARYDPEKLEWRPNVPAETRADAKTRKWVAGYYGLCSSLDHEMGRLLKALDDKNLAQNTLVVFTSDHGDMLGSHGLYFKSKPEEESLHVPLFMRLPGRIREKQLIPALASSIDLTPTILSICGLKPAAGVAGRDLSAAALGGPGPEIDSVYAEGMMRNSARVERLAPANAASDGDRGPAGVSGGMEWRALVTRSHKLVVRADNQVAALFNLEKDLYETKNLAGDQSVKALENELLARMRRWSKETGDPFPAASPAARAMYTDEEAARSRT
ncbi:MAG: sulfatase [Bryobacteraceae bacterium]